MTNQQTTAFLSPCFHPEETQDPIFYRLAIVNGVRLSVGLTVNVGLE